MALHLKAGDVVLCCLLNGKIVSPYASYEETKDFEIISIDSEGYFIYVPNYFSIKGSVEIFENNVKKLKINKKFLGCQMIYINDNLILKIKNIINGISCKRCNEFFNQAEANQEDGSFLCFLCRSYRYR